MAYAAPQRGWSFVDLRDVLGHKIKCEMCGTAWVRYVHKMQHPDYAETKDVGCCCAARMEQDPNAATLRELQYRSYYQRRNNWLTRDGWRISSKGNHYINVEHCNVVVWKEKKGWIFQVKHRATEVTWRADAPLATQEEAKLAAFDKLPRHFEEFRWHITDATIDQQNRAEME